MSSSLDMKLEPAVWRGLGAKRPPAISGDQEKFRALIFIGEIGGRDALRTALTLALGREIPEGWFWITEYRE